MLEGELKYNSKGKLEVSWNTQEALKYFGLNITPSELDTIANMALNPGHKTDNQILDEIHQIGIKDIHFDKYDRIVRFFDELMSNLESVNIWEVSDSLSLSEIEKTGYVIDNIQESEGGKRMANTQFGTKNKPIESSFKSFNDFLITTINAISYDDPFLDLGLSELMDEDDFNLLLTGGAKPGKELAEFIFEEAKSIGISMHKTAYRKLVDKIESKNIVNINLAPEKQDDEIKLKINIITNEIYPHYPAVRIPYDEAKGSKFYKDMLSSLNKKFNPEGKLSENELLDMVGEAILKTKIDHDRGRIRITPLILQGWVRKDPSMSVNDLSEALGNLIYGEHHSLDKEIFVEKSKIFYDSVMGIDLRTPYFEKSGIRLQDALYALRNNSGKSIVDTDIRGSMSHHESDSGPDQILKKTLSKILKELSTGNTKKNVEIAARLANMGYIFKPDEKLNTKQLLNKMFYDRGISYQQAENYLNSVGYEAKGETIGRYLNIGGATEREINDKAMEILVKVLRAENSEIIAANKQQNIEDSKIYGKKISEGRIRTLEEKYSRTLEGAKKGLDDLGATELYLKFERKVLEEESKKDFLTLLNDHFKERNISALQASVFLKKQHNVTLNESNIVQYLRGDRPIRSNVLEKFVLVLKASTGDIESANKDTYEKAMVKPAAAISTNRISLLKEKYRETEYYKKNYDLEHEHEDMDIKDILARLYKKRGIDYDTAHQFFNKLYDPTFTRVQFRQELFGETHFKASTVEYHIDFLSMQKSDIVNNKFGIKINNEKLIKGPISATEAELIRDKFAETPFYTKNYIHKQDDNDIPFNDLLARLIRERGTTFNHISSYIEKKHGVSFSPNVVRHQVKGTSTITEETLDYFLDVLTAPNKEILKHIKDERCSKYTITGNAIDSARAQILLDKFLENKKEIHTKDKDKKPKTSIRQKDLGEASSFTKAKSKGFTRGKSEEDE